MNWADVQINDISVSMQPSVGLRSANGLLCNYVSRLLTGTHLGPFWEGDGLVPWKAIESARQSD